MAIPPDQIEALSRKVARIFTVKELDWVLRKTTGDMLFEVVARGLNDRETSSDLLDRISAVNLDAKLLAEMLARRPNDPEFGQMVARANPAALTLSTREELDLSLQAAGAPVADAPPNGFAPGLQRNVRPHLHKLDLMVWGGKAAARSQPGLPDRDRVARGGDGFPCRAAGRADQLARRGQGRRRRRA